MAEYDCYDVRQAFYAMWRFNMWAKGYGTYEDIDEAVVRGELEPGKDYPQQSDQSTERT